MTDKSREMFRAILKINGAADAAYPLRDDSLHAIKAPAVSVPKGSTGLARFSAQLYQSGIWAMAHNYIDVVSMFNNEPHTAGEGFYVTLLERWYQQDCANQSSYDQVANFDICPSRGEELTITSVKKGVQGLGDFGSRFLEVTFSDAMFTGINGTFRSIVVYHMPSKFLISYIDYGADTILFPSNTLRVSFGDPSVRIWGF